MSRWIIVDNYKNTITFDSLDKELTLEQIILKNRQYAKRHKTFKELDKTIHEVIKKEPIN